MQRRNLELGARRKTIPDYSRCVHTHSWRGGPTGKTSPPRWVSVRPLSQSLHHILARYTHITSSLTPLPTGSQHDSSTNKKSHYQLLHRTNCPMSMVTAHQFILGTAAHLVLRNLLHLNSTTNTLNGWLIQQLQTTENYSLNSLMCESLLLQHYSETEL
jgi:hypothetical protein